MSALVGMLQSIQFVIGPDGRPTAVQIGIEAWNSLLDWLEDADRPSEDRAIVKAAIPRLRSGPEKAAALRWDEVRAEWDQSEGASSTQ